MNSFDCKKCHSSFNKEGRVPLFLPSCGHTLCRSCLQDIIKHDSFNCIECGVKQPKVNLSDLKPNHVLLEIIASMNDENGLPGKKRHRSEKGDAAAAAAADRDRDESIKRNIKDECTDHERVELKYWCVTCDVATCSECMLEKHRQHQYEKTDDFLETRRSELKDLVLKVTNAIDTAKEKQTTFAKSSFSVDTNKIRSQAVCVLNKIKKVAPELTEFIQKSENGEAEIRELRQKMNNLIQKASPASPTAAGNVAEIKALLKHIQCIKSFLDDDMAKVLKGVDAEKDQQKFMSSVFIYIAVHTADLSVKAADLFRKMVSCGEGWQLGVIHGKLMGSLTWENKKLHFHCFHQASNANPCKPATDPSRSYSLKWAILQRQMREVTQVFVVLGMGVQDQADSVSERIYWKLCRPDSTTTTTSATKTACQRFLHLVLGDDGTNSLLDSYIEGVQQLLSGVRVILLGTHHQEEEKGEEKSKEGVTKDTTNMTDSHVTSNASNAKITVAAGDVIRVKKPQRKGDAEFWLVTDTTTLTVKHPVDCEVVGKLLLPAHKNLQTRLESLKGRKVKDCGVVLSIE